MERIGTRVAEVSVAFRGLPISSQPNAVFRCVPSDIMIQPLTDSTQSNAMILNPQCDSTSPRRFHLSHIPLPMITRRRTTPTSPPCSQSHSQSSFQQPGTHSKDALMGPASIESTFENLPAPRKRTFSHPFRRTSSSSSSLHDAGSKGNKEDHHHHSLNMFRTKSHRSISSNDSALASPSESSHSHHFFFHRRRSPRLQPASTPTPPDASYVLPPLSRNRTAPNSPLLQITPLAEMSPSEMGLALPPFHAVEKERSLMQEVLEESPWPLRDWDEDDEDGRNDSLDLDIVRLFILPFQKAVNRD